MTNRQWHPDNIDPVEELSYTPLKKSYLKTQAVITALIWLGLMLLPLFLLLADEFDVLLADEFDGRNLIVICAETVLLAAGLVNLSILPKAYAYKGYAVREHDITYRSGIVFPKTVTIPFCKVQQVSVRQNPVSRMFGLYAVDVVSGAQMLAFFRAEADERECLLGTFCEGAEGVCKPCRVVGGDDCHRL